MILQQLNEDVDLYLLSTEYELTGGFIRNAATIALKSSLLRDDNPTNIILTQNDLKKRNGLNARLNNNNVCVFL